jgi:glycosyltransferase involved in cell wall biosynthesis
VILGVNGIRLLGKRSGVGRATAAILDAMAEIGHPFDEIRVYTPEPLPPDLQLPPGARNVVLPSWLSPALWEQVVLPKAHGRRDLLLCPSYVAPLLARCATLLIHHGSYEGYPEAFPWWARTKARAIYGLSARKASVVTTVSEHSRRDIARFYGVTLDKIHVIPEGVDTRLFRPLDDSRQLSHWRRATFGEDAPFLLYVGKPSKRRNLPSLIRAFAALKQEGIPHKLLLIGTDLPGTPFQQSIEDMGLGGEIFTVGFATHEEMVLAYNAAELLVYPSSYEGFGMPVLEAMACGTPAIALNNTAFPEFSGGVAMLLEDARPATLQAGIANILGDPVLRERMAREGPRRAVAYDWRPVTRRYLDLMTQMIGAEVR